MLKNHYTLFFLASAKLTVTLSGSGEICQDKFHFYLRLNPIHQILGIFGVVWHPYEGLRLSEAPRKVRTHNPKALHGRHKALGCNNGTSKPNPPDMYLYIIDYVVREIDPVFCVTHIESFACTP